MADQAQSALLHAFKTGNAVLGLQKCENFLSALEPPVAISPVLREFAFQFSNSRLYAWDQSIAQSGKRIALPQIWIVEVEGICQHLVKRVGILSLSLNGICVPICTVQPITLGLRRSSLDLAGLFGSALTVPLQAFGARLPCLLRCGHSTVADHRLGERDRTGSVLVLAVNMRMVRKTAALGVLDAPRLPLPAPLDRAPMFAAPVLPETILAPRAPRRTRQLDLTQ